MPTYEVTYPGFPPIEVNAGTAQEAAQKAPKGFVPISTPHEDVVVQVRHLGLNPSTTSVVVRWALVGWEIPEGHQPADRLPVELQLWGPVETWPLTLAQAVATFGHTRRGNRLMELAEPMKSEECHPARLTVPSTRERVYIWLCEQIDQGDDDFRLPLLRAELLRCYPELRSCS